MTSVTLAQSYFEKARKRLRALATLFEDEAYSDVVREAQELVELVLKGILRFVGIEPPKQHDVGRLLVQHRDRLPESVAAAVDRLAEISHRLRKERTRSPNRRTGEAEDGRLGMAAPAAANGASGRAERGGIHRPRPRS